MSGLADLLADVADEAKVYGDTERAVRVLRRRRRATRLAPVVLAAVVTLAVSVTYVAVRRGPGHMTPSGIVSWLPSRLLPDADAPPLPTDHGVGPGSLLYAVRADHAVLVTADLHQYALPPAVSPPLSLSPDGRWLVSVVDRRIVLRDLTGTATRDLFALPDGEINTAWSSDGHTFAIQPLTSEGTTIVVDLDSLRSHRIAMRLRLCGAQDSGKLLGCPSAGEPVSVTLVDAATGELGSTVTADLASVLTPAEQQANLVVNSMSAGVVGQLAGGDVVAVRTSVYNAKFGVIQPGDLLLVDVATGRFIRRIALPPQAEPRTVPMSGGVAFLAEESRSVGTGLPEGIPLVHEVPVGAADPYAVKVAGVEFADPRTGARVEAMTVSGTVVMMIVRGSGI